MYQSSDHLNEIKLVGIKIRTSFMNEKDLQKGKIFPCVQKYFHERLFEKIPNRMHPGKTFCVYTEYESDYRGEYSYFIGEKVFSLENLPLGFQPLIIPSQQYVKFTTKPGPMPQVVKNAWEKIWQMSLLNGKRLYHSDFEIYDERASDHNNVVLDIYIGVENKNLKN